MSGADPRRSEPIDVTWSGHCGHMAIAGALWASVEWSEKRQAWCIEDAQGQCLTHASSLHGTAPSKEEAAALAEAMIRDGRMPSPEEARQRRQEEKASARAKRKRQPSYQRHKQEREAKREHSLELMLAKWNAEKKERLEQPLYELLADIFDFADPNLWKSNTFASLRPRLVVHLRAAIAGLEQELFHAIERQSQQLRERLDRARTILAQLEGAA